MIELVGGANKEGYSHALLRVFGSPQEAPDKAAFCRKRKQISFKFFQQCLDNLISDFEPNRLEFKGLRIYAVDGLQLHLPRTEDIIDAGYNGRAVSKYRESHQPRMYVVHGYDVLSGITKNVIEACYLDELHGARNMVKFFESNSLTLYDRLYISTGVIMAHKEAGNYFLMRARRNSFKEVEEFYSSHKQKASCIIAGVEIQMLKVTNPRTGKTDAFITNLPRSQWVTADTIRRLYRLRWEVEVSFKDLCDTLKVEQWHSKFINGIRQEFYAIFWLINFVKIQMNKCWQRLKITLADVYLKPNLKLAINFIRDRFGKFVLRKRGLLAELKTLLENSTEKRFHESRAYPREIKSADSPYPRNNTVWNVS